MHPITHLAPGARSSGVQAWRVYMCDCCMYHDRLNPSSCLEGVHHNPYAMCLLAHAISRLESLLAPSGGAIEDKNRIIETPRDMPADAIVSQRLEWLHWTRLLKRLLRDSRHSRLGWLWRGKVTALLAPFSLRLPRAWRMSALALAWAFSRALRASDRSAVHSFGGVIHQC